MATFSKATITWWDELKRPCTMRFKGPYGRAFAYVTNLRTALNAFTNAGLKQQKLITVQTMFNAPTGNTRKRAIITLADADGEIHKWEFPDFSGVVERDKEGEYVNLTDLATIMAAISAYTGESYTPLRSPIIMR